MFLSKPAISKGNPWKSAVTLYPYLHGYGVHRYGLGYENIYPRVTPGIPYRCYDNGGRKTVTECEVIWCRSKSINVYQGRSGHIEGISGVSFNITSVQKVIGMMYECLAGCSTSFGAYDVMWTYHPPPYWNPDCPSQLIRVMCWSWGHVENWVQSSSFSSNSPL